MTSRASPTSPLLTMAATVPLQRQQSFQSSILFMQQEHATTLKGLHAEIQKLQKRCSELTFQVAMGTASSPQEDFYRNKAEKLENELAEKVAALTDVTGSVEKKEKRVTALEQQLRAQEKKYLEKIKAQEQQVRQLKTDLAEKAALNADLMLRRLGQSQEKPTVIRLTTSSLDTEDCVRSRESDLRTGTPPPVPPIKVPLTPHPPKDAAGLRSRRRLSPRAIRVEGEPKLASKVKPRAASGRTLKASRPDTPEEIPDPTPFLQLQHDDQTEVHSKKPLPPIGVRTEPHTDLDVIPPQQTTSRAFVAKKKALNKKHGSPQLDQSPDSSSPEVEVLAVDSVIRRDHKLRHAHDYKSADCN